MKKPTIGDKLKAFDYEDIKKAVNILYLVFIYSDIGNNKLFNDV